MKKEDRLRRLIYKTQKEVLKDQIMPSSLKGKIGFKFDDKKMEITLFNIKNKK